MEPRTRLLLLKYCCLRTTEAATTEVLGPLKYYCLRTRLLATAKAGTTVHVEPLTKPLLLTTEVLLSSDQAATTEVLLTSDQATTTEVLLTSDQATIATY